ncbi:MAG TPA: putative zinc-binding metallopeptidase [Candidatus Limnocylindria bacterium]|nr:putative zinc-binding metallopeptidase [Candidatus Limnocylindria bacterium]
MRCNHVLGFLPDVIDLSPLESKGDGTWRALAPAAHGRIYRQCANGQQHQVCNWLVPAEDSNPFCVSCRLNEVIPDLTVPNNRELWQKLETAKRRVIYTLLRLRLPTEGAPLWRRHPLRFRFLSDPAGGPPVLTGHDEGVITINVAEADDSERERRRVTLREPFRTLLGHMRHEVAHYYWEELLVHTRQLHRFRKLFGDETRDYGAALQNYYQQGPPGDWQMRHVSAYAAAHPWEDWAETSAHYFHIVDTVETAASFGVTLRPRHPDAKAMTADPKNISAWNGGFDRILENWLPLTYALNELNRGMGLSDLYPFVLSAPAIEKLRFVHEVLNIRAQR